MGSAAAAGSRDVGGIGIVSAFEMGIFNLHSGTPTWSSSWTGSRQFSGRDRRLLRNRKQRALKIGRRALREH